MKTTAKEVPKQRSAQSVRHRCPVAQCEVEPAEPVSRARTPLYSTPVARYVHTGCWEGRCTCTCSKWLGHEGSRSCKTTKHKNREKQTQMRSGPNTAETRDLITYLGDAARKQHADNHKHWPTTCGPPGFPRFYPRYGAGRAAC